MSPDVKIRPGDIIRLKEPYNIFASEGIEGVEEDRNLLWTVDLKMGKGHELVVLQNIDNIITCRAVESCDHIMRAYITVDFDLEKIEWDRVEIVKGKKI